MATEEAIKAEYGEEAEQGAGFAKFGKDAKRYVLFNETRGIYTGESDDWTYETAGQFHDRVITYLKFQLGPIRNLLIDKGTATQVVEVVPDKKFGQASIDACEAAGLPRWEYTGPRPKG